MSVRANNSKFQLLCFCHPIVDRATRADCLELISEFITEVHTENRLNVHEFIQFKLNGRINKNRSLTKDFNFEKGRL